jgi:mRNA interferase RelE/StbE
VTDAPYELVVTAPAARAIREKLPEAVAFAVIDFITGPLLDNPKRVGAPLRGGVEGIWSARRGTYRVLYRVDEDNREVIVLGVGHRPR